MPPEYSASQIRVVEFDEHVRRRPAMYFTAGQGDAELPTRVLAGVLSAAFHPVASLAGAHVPVVLADVTADLGFTVVDDQASPFDPRGPQPQGFCGSLLRADRGMLAAALALSARAVVEAWRDGQGLRQELTGLRPLAPAVTFAAPPGNGTRAIVELDPDYFGPDAALTADLSTLELHSPECVTSGPGYILVRRFKPPIHLPNSATNR